MANEDSTNLALTEEGVSTLPALADELNTSNESIVSRFVNAELARQIIIGAILLLSVFFIIMIFVWLYTPEKRPLASYQTDELIPILDYLDQQEINYSLEGNTVLVNSKEYDAIKLQLTRAGFSSQDEQGDDILLQDMGFGVSQQLERERLKLSRERQLASAIENIRAVAKAKVLLAMPKQSLFVRHNQEATATVFLTVRGNTQLGLEEVDSIVDMVSSAVPNLHPARVTVTDQHGRLLSSGSQVLQAGQHRKEYELEQQQEQHLREKIDAILIPVLGLGNYTAQVDVALDFSATEETQKQFLPKPQGIIRSEHTSEQYNNSDLVAGIPGALTNQPPQSSAIPETIENLSSTEKSAQGSLSKEATRNYEVDSTIRHRKGQSGVIARQTVSVAVDYIKATNAQGEITQVPMAAEELEKIRRLLIGGVGFFEARGDLLEVVAVSFAKSEQAHYATPPIWEHQYFNDWLRWAMAAIVILVVLLTLIRPLVKKLTIEEEGLRVGPDGEILGADGLPIELDDELDVELIGTDLESYKQLNAGSTSLALPNLDKHDDLFKAARAMVTSEPELAAQVVKGWLKSDE